MTQYNLSTLALYYGCVEKHENQDEKTKLITQRYETEGETKNESTKLINQNFQQEAEVERKDETTKQKEKRKKQDETSKLIFKKVKREKKLEEKPGSYEMSRSLIRAWRKYLGNKRFYQLCREMNLDDIQPDQFKFKLLIRFCNAEVNFIHSNSNFLEFIQNHQFIEEFDKMKRIKKENYKYYIDFVDNYLPQVRKKMQT